VKRAYFKKRKPIFFATIVLLSTVIIAGVFIHLTAKTKITENIPSRQVLSTTAHKNPVKSTVPATVSPTNIPQTRSVYLGMWTAGLWDDKALLFHPETLHSVENKIGKKVAIAHFYTGWSNLDNPSFISQLDVVSTNGWRPMVSANPYFFDQCQANGKTLYRTIADGACDDFFKNVGISLKQYGHPLFLRFAWEMNIPTMEWSVQKTGDTPSDYIAAWRRIHDIVTSQGATNVIWVFAPNTLSSSSTPYNQLYPGDSYVDWIGLDGYNWGTTQSWSNWQGFSQVFSASYTALTGIAPSKPLILSEVNTTDKGGDKPSWYTDMLTQQIPYNYPRIAAVVFYNEDRTQQENVNWLFDSSSASLTSFKQGISLPLYSTAF